MLQVAIAARQIARRLARRPGFTLTAVTVLALGIGANVAIFSAFRAVLLAPLPFPAPERLVEVTETLEETGGDLTSLSPPNFTDLRDQSEVFSAIAALHQGGLAFSGQDLPAELVPGAYVTGGFFDVLGVAPELGRPFLIEDLQPGAPPAVILSWDLWRRRFGADPGVVGRRVEVDGAETLVVGVMPQGFRFPEGIEVWAPRSFTIEDLTTQRGAHYLAAVARLAPGVTLAEANAEVATIGARLASSYPDQNIGRSFAVRDLKESLVGEYREALWMLIGAVALVLLVVCFNVANLLLARFLERRQELSVRSALGASPGQVIRDVLAEGLALAVLGGLAAWGVARLGVSALTTLESVDLPRLAETRLDTASILFGLALTTAAGLLSAGLPAFRLVAGGRGAARLGGASRTGGDRGNHRLRSVLVVSEAALAVVLVCGASLLARSFWNLRSVDPGFDPDDVLTFNLILNEQQYPAPARRAAFVDELLERLEAHPGVARAGAVFGLPFSGLEYVISVERLDGAPAYDRPGTESYVQVRVITPEYLQALGLPLEAGRGFTAADDAAAPPVALVNRAAARLLWPEGDALGHTLEVGSRLISDGERRAGGEVVGVVGDVRYRALAEDPVPELYVSYAQFPMDFLTVVAKVEGEPAAFTEEMRALASELDPRLPLFQVQTMERRLASSVSQNRLYALLLGLFAVTALVLATVGLYGLMAFTASQKTRDIGIRMALGASRERIVGWMLRQGLALTAAGGVLGALVSLAAAEALRSWLFELEPDDPVTLAAAVLVLIVSAFFASLAPARRASRVDPAETLKQE